MKHDLVSRAKRIQMDLNSRLSTCVDEKTASSMVVTGVTYHNVSDAQVIKGKMLSPKK